MAVKFKDYYESLGVKRDASQEELQRAYRKAARQYHPDVNKDPKAQEKFREVSEAYEVLKDPEKRKRYDELGANWKAGQDFRPPPGYENVEFSFNGGPFGGRQAGGFSPGGFSEFFEMLFGQGRGASGFEEMFGNAGGGARAGRRGHQTLYEEPRGAPTERLLELDITLEEAYRGGTRQLVIEDGGKRKTIEVRIPRGAKDGSRIRLRGENLMLKLRIVKHPSFTVDGRNIRTDVKVAPWEAALGAKVPVRTLDGEVTLTIPPGSQSGQKLRLAGKGMANPKGKDGDLLAEIRIVVPKELSDTQRELFEKMRDEAGFDPRG